ncbi:MAG: CRISPR system precrRNA processing endoribonuclease RAMP protein Cas6 [Ktedonobacteraceae bacterium]|nr:CRISPR system precrRNA processing endoribonuclease RAMP protein Cas6 [Ktedonobacteraceae bacterium]
MGSLVTHHFLFTTEVVTPLELDQHSGSALRGNLFQSVWERFCSNKVSPSCADCMLHATCPVSALVAPLREENPRGRDIPRPYIILPPLGETRRYEAGETLLFGVTLFGSIIQLLPYLMLSASALEAAGLGRKLPEHRGSRGRFRIKHIEAYNPLSGLRQRLYEKGKPLVDVPTLPVSVADVQASASQLSTSRITLTFLTPTRIVEKEHLLHHAVFAPLMHRLLERLTALEEAYGEEASMTTEELWRLVELAEQVHCVEDATTWEELASYSNRLKRLTPIAGLLGHVTFSGDLTPFREFLLWGELIHIGKSCVKGNGWYRVER